MKRSWTILLASLALALAGYLIVYHATRSSCGIGGETTHPELAWLKLEFQLGDAEFERVSALHRSYLPACESRCIQIDAKNDQLRTLLASAGAVTPDVERALAEATELRRECQAAMLRHFVEVSRAMPPEAGRRYLAWVCARTLGKSHASMTSAGSAPASAHEHSGH